MRVRVWVRVWVSDRVRVRDRGSGRDEIRDRDSGRVRVRRGGRGSMDVSGTVIGRVSGRVWVSAGSSERSGPTRPTLALYYQHSYSYTGTHTRWHAY